MDLLEQLAREHEDGEQLEEEQQGSDPKASPSNGEGYEQMARDGVVLVEKGLNFFFEGFEYPKEIHDSAASEVSPCLEKHRVGESMAKAGGGIPFMVEARAGLFFGGLLKYTFGVIKLYLKQKKEDSNNDQREHSTPESTHVVSGKIGDGEKPMYEEGRGDTQESQNYTI